MLYVCIKTGIPVRLEDMGMNVLFDLLNFTAEVDSQAIEKSEGKTLRRSAPMSLAEMTKAGKTGG